MMKQLRRALARVGSTAALFLLLLLPAAQASPGEEAAGAYRSGQYSHALQCLEKDMGFEGEEALNLYNRGNCEYRLGNSGKAALLYARALQRDPGLKEAQANLAFIQRKEGANVFLPLPEDAVFTYLTPAQLRACTYVCTALLALLAALWLLRGKAASPYLRGAVLGAALCSLLCGLDWLYYGTREVPALGMLAPQDTAYVLTPTSARTAADEQSPIILELKASTPLHLLAKRGPWCYIETTSNGTRGWVPSAAIEALEPNTPPLSPLILRF